MRRLFLVFLVTSFFAALSKVQAQSVPKIQPSRCELWGVIVSSNRSCMEGMKVELVREGETHAQSTRVIQGAFDFQSILPGIYHFRLIDRYGKVVVWKTQPLTGIDDHVVLYLPYAISEPLDIVSRVELNHKTPRQAQKAFRTALRAEELGDLPGSIEAFGKAPYDRPAA